MSALGGIYNFGGASVDESVLAILGRRLEANAMDGGREVKLGLVGMAYRALHTNRESRLEVQPLVSQRGHILSWDGRLDNREELISQLSDDLLGNMTDVAIVMAAYVKWGIECLPRLIGDFALSLWDPDLRMLLLARDPFGARTLYYHPGNDSIKWASDLLPLLELSRIDSQIEDEYIAGYLTHEPEPSLTPYKHIRSVCPGECVMYKGEQLHAQRYWGFNPNLEIRYKSDAEYEEQFRVLFSDSVGCRLRSDQAVFSELSGGLDSSSIVCMADVVLNAGNAQAPSLETVSYVYDQSPTSDERKFIQHVENQRGRIGYHLREEDYPFLDASAIEYKASLPSFIFPYYRRHLALCEAMRANKSRVLLTGQGGDHLLWSCEEFSTELADLLLQFRLFRLHQLAREFARAQKRTYLEMLWRGAILPLLPRKIQAACQPPVEIPPWYDQDFASRLNLRDRHLMQPDRFGFHLPSGKRQSSVLAYAIDFISAGYYRDWGCMDVSFPFLHRPLVEFLLAIPVEQKFRPGEMRSVQRRALREILPEKIAKRRGKRGPDEALFRALSREWQMLSPMLANAQVCARGYINSKQFAEALERSRYGTERCSGRLMRTLSLELWFQSLQHNGCLTRSTSDLGGLMERSSSDISKDTTPFPVSGVD
jgi:asparagine synthase (glutamine-hydrolysing)